MPADLMDAGVSLTRNRIVRLMMLLVSAAAGAMLYAQLGVSAVSSAFSACAMFAFCLLIETLQARAKLIAKLRSDVKRLERELGVDREQAGNKPTASDKATHSTVEAKPEPRLTKPAAPPASIGVPDRVPSDVQWEAPQMARPAQLTAPKPPAPDVRHSQAGGVQAPGISGTQGPGAVAAAVPPPPKPPEGRSELVAAPNWSGTAVAAPDPLRDAWSFRPRDAADTRALSPDAEIVRQPPASTMEYDLDLVQRKIKALAEEVNANEISKARLVAEPARPQASFGQAALEIESGIAALRSAAGTMRAPAAGDHVPVVSQSVSFPSLELPSPESLIPATAETIAVSAPASAVSNSIKSGSSSVQRPMAPEPVEMRAAPAAPAPSVPVAAPASRVPGDTRILDIAKAIELRRMDVLLSPIVGLSDYAVTHFEVIVRLRGPNGETLENPEQALSLAGSHLLALFDAERLSRTAKVADQLAERGKTGSVLTATSGQSMSDANFLETFARVYETRNTISGQLVLTFSQADVEAFGSGTWQALEDMQSFGFRFALEGVMHLDQDFEDLARKGFAFVKLDAPVFLDGLPAGKGRIPAHDICRHLSRSGLTLVVNNVDDEGLLARVFGFGVLFGQGQLFGAPRTVSLDAAGSRRSAA